MGKIQIMYPNLSYIFHALFGSNPDNIFSVVQTFGLMLGLSFVASGTLLYLELKRKTGIGQLQGRIENIVVYKPIDWKEIGMQCLVNTILAYKAGYVISNVKEFQLDPTGILFSSKGNFLWAFIALAATFAYWFYKMKSQKENTLRRADVMIQPKDRVFEITGVAAIFGIVGSRLFSILENFGDFIRDPIGSIFSGSGLTIYGGLILAFIMVFRYIKKKGLHPIHMMDAVAPTLMIGYAVGRMGCHLSGDGDWGIINELAKPSWFILPDSWWAYHYPHNVIDEGVKIEGCTWMHCHQLVPPVYPTPLYESILAFIITGILWALRKQIPYAGVLFFLYCLLNGIERIFIEAIRVNPRYELLGMNPSLSQIIAFLLIIVGIVGLIYFWKKKIR